MEPSYLCRWPLAYGLSIHSVRQGRRKAGASYGILPDTVRQAGQLPGRQAKGQVGQAGPANAVAFSTLASGLASMCGPGVKDPVLQLAFPVVRAGTEANLASGPLSRRNCGHPSAQS